MLTLTFLAIFGFSQVAHAGYIQHGGYYSPTVVQQPAATFHPSFLNSPAAAFTYPSFRPAKQPLQLRPPASVVAVPNTGPPVVAIHAEQRPVTPTHVVAIQAQSQPIPVSTTVTVPNYSFAYAVKDAVTGDEKSHEETRTGDNVIGRYTVVEPDGTLRTVTYTAGIGGFNAVVEKTPGYAPPNAPVKVVAVSKPVSVVAPPQFISVSRPSIPISPVPVAISRPVASASVGSSLGLPPGAVSLPVSYPPGFHFGG